MFSYALPSSYTAPSQLEVELEPNQGSIYSTSNASLTALDSNARSHTHDIPAARRHSSFLHPADEDAQAAEHHLAPLDSTGRNSSFTSPQEMLSRGRSRGESDLGRPPIARARSAPNYPSSSSTAADVTQFLLSETLTAFLIPLPFLLTSLLGHPHFHKHKSHGSSWTGRAEDALEEVATTAIPIPFERLTLIQAFAITSGTLLLVGLFGRMRLTNVLAVSKRKGHTLASKPNSTKSLTFGLSTIRRLFFRIVCVGLPFLATIELGGIRTGTILLSAIASGLIFPAKEVQGVKTWKKVFTTHKGFCATFILSLIFDVYRLREDTEYTTIFRGYLALAKSVLFLQLPLPTNSQTTSKLTETSIDNVASPNTPATEANITKAWEAAAAATHFNESMALSPLISTLQDVDLTLIAGGVSGAIAFLLSTVVSSTIPLNYSTLTVASASIVCAACLLLSSEPTSLCSKKKFGLVIALIASTVFGFHFECRTWGSVLALSSLSAFAYLAVQYDTRNVRPKKLRSTSTHINTHSHKLDDDHQSHHHLHARSSKLTGFLLKHTEDWPLLHDILAEKESRRIVYFMFINLAFMFVQTFYALVAGSLGLLSDSIHMFFDCVGLLAGLIASVMSRWPPNSKYPYGYGKVETLSGLGNGIFLMIISVEIIWESFERFIEGAELKRLTELFLVSVGGLVVNLIGLVFIGHAHHGHGHGHEGHDHSHDNENIMGIYLHILADTMGSVAVILSTMMTAYTGWSGWDPLASCIIAVLIIAASVPLVVGSAKKLLLTIPDEVEYSLRNALQEVSGLRGVAGYAVPRFWLDDSDSHHHGHDHDHHHGHKHDHDEVDHHQHTHNGHLSITNHKPNSHSHSHSHSHSSSSSLSYAQSAHDHETEHQHNHNHNHNHSHSHSHSHSRTHSHSHSHDHDHDDHHHNHNHSHSHPHPQDEPEHEHKHKGPRVLGVIHVIASRGADMEDVRSRTESFFRERNMHIVVHVEKEGQGKCWCGGQNGGEMGLVAM